jgi:hypothetical protein
VNSKNSEFEGINETGKFGVRNRSRKEQTYLYTQQKIEQNEINYIANK